MANIPNYKPIKAEDFSQDFKQIIDRIGFSLNPFAQQIIDAFNKGLDFNNLNQEIVSLSKIQVTSGGNPTETIKFKSNLKSSVKGLQCIKAENTTDGAYLTGAPFFNFSQSDNIITINNITGLQVNKKYNISLISLG